MIHSQIQVFCNSRKSCFDNSATITQYHYLGGRNGVSRSPGNFEWFFFNNFKRHSSEDTQLCYVHRSAQGLRARGLGRTVPASSGCARGFVYFRCSVSRCLSKNPGVPAVEGLRVG